MRFAPAGAIVCFMRYLASFSFLAATSLLIGCGADDTPTELQGLGFDLSVESNSGQDACTFDCARPTLYLEKATEASIEFIYGVPGRLERGTLVADGDAFKLESPLSLSKDPYDAGFACSSYADLSSGTFDFSDHDGDGKIDLVLTGAYGGMACGDDYEFAFDGTLTMKGSPDTTAPSVRSYFSSRPLDPIDLVTWEPLRSGATASLEAPSGTSIPLVPKLVDGFVMGFESDVILALGASHAIQLDGVDLVGQGPAAQDPLTTMSDPGILPEDGFESGTLLGVSHDDSALVPAIVGDYFGVPVPNGQAALHAGFVTYMHLARKSGATRIVMNVRKIVESCGDPTQSEPSLVFTAGVVGTSARVEKSVSLGSGTTSVATSADCTAAVSDVQSIEIPVNEPGSDVILVIECGSAGYFGAFNDAQAIIDDVRME